jgi:hypothetical protein
MSTIFEGVLCRASKDDLDIALDGLDAVSDIRRSGRGELVYVQIAPDVSAVYVSKSDPRGVFLDEVWDVAVSLSRTFGKSLLVRYDDRVGYRSAVYFVEGVEEAVYAADDELWVPLDDEGDLVLSENPIHKTEFDEDTEYETIENAIQLGLKRFGVGEWAALQRLIYNG